MLPNDLNEGTKKIDQLRKCEAVAVAMMVARRWQQGQGQGGSSSGDTKKETLLWQQRGESSGVEGRVVVARRLLW